MKKNQQIFATITVHCPLWSNKVLEIMEVDILYYYIDENFHFQK